MSQLDPPTSFFGDLADTKATRNVFGGADGKYGWKPSSVMLWYDGIIDDLLANPGTSIKDTAKRLGRHPHTISLIASSDLFKARYEQRRKDYNDKLHDRLTAKLTEVAEKALDHTITALDQKRESVPLPLLHEIAKGSLDRLGYAPQSSSPIGATVINNNIVAAGTVSPEALARARSHLRDLQLKTITNPSSPPVAGPKVEGEGEEG
jgi:hypothetical protein